MPPTKTLRPFIAKILSRAGSYAYADKGEPINYTDMLCFRLITIIPQKLWWRRKK